MNKWIFALLLLTGCGEQENHQVLKVGTNAEFAPFAFIENGQIQGFEIDLIHEVGRRLGVQIQLQDLPFEALIPTLQMDGLDCVAAGMSITAEREKAVLFSLPYIDGEPLCAVWDPKRTHFTRLSEMHIVVNDGYTAELWVSENLEAQPLRLGNPVEAMLALASGRAEVFITARNTLAPLIKDTELEVLEIENTAENCSLMFPKAQTQLAAQIDEVLQQMIEDGTITAFRDKWGLL